MGPVPKKAFEWQSPPSPCYPLSEELVIPPIPISTVVEVETVEMCIDDEEEELPASSLLLLPLLPAGNGTQSAPTESCCCCSPPQQELAATSVVTGQHHATAVHKPWTEVGVPTAGQWDPESCDGEAMSVHCLKFESAHSWTHCTSQWSRHLLAFTDNAGLVGVIRADLARLFTRCDPCGHSRHASTAPEVQVMSCADASQWTSCQVDCCQADVELLPPAGGVGQHTKTVLPLTGVVDSLHLSAPSGLRLLPMPGLTADRLHDPRLSCFSMTYLLLLQEEEESSLWPTADVVLVLPASVQPWSSGTLHRFFVKSSNEVPGTASCQRRRALAVLVDVVRQTDDTERQTITAIVHERYHHLPDLEFGLISPVN